MKKFFALLFVTAAMTTMAAVPHVNNNAKIYPGKPQPAMAAHQMAAPVMQTDVTVQGFFAGKQLRPDQLVKQAPRRLTADAVTGTKIAFMLGYSYDDESGAVAADNIYYWGGWDAEVVSNGNTLDAYLYYNSTPFTIIPDYGHKTAEMVMGDLGSFQWTDTVVTGSGQIVTINDTIEYLVLVDEGYIMGGDVLTNLTGTISEDGSIHFADGWCVYQLDCVTKTVKRAGQSTVTRDTIDRITPFFRDTYLMTPSGTHTYVDPDNNEHVNNVYMYQEDDCTVVVWNLFGLGMRGNYMQLDEEGTMYFPNLQHGGDMASQRDFCEAEHPDFDWTDADHVTFMAYDASAGAPDKTAANILGSATTAAITWPYTVWSWWGVSTADGHQAYVFDEPYTDNVLVFTNGNSFVLPGSQQVMIGDVNGDGQVNITDVTALISAVLNDDLSNIIVANSDLTDDGSINISDVTALIAMVLNS